MILCIKLASYFGQLFVARILVNRGVDLEARDIYGTTPAHLAIDANNLEMIKFVLDSGANREARDLCGWTLLMRAGKYHSKQIIFLNKALNII